MAQCLARQDRFEEAAAELDAGLLHAARTGDILFEPELHRVKGDLLLRRDPAAVTEAERSYRAAIERARLQDSKSLELRAAASLARLWRDQGKPAEARELLAPIYGWFTEGFDTPDLKDTAKLLSELA